MVASAQNNLQVLYTTTMLPNGSEQEIYWLLQDTSHCSDQGLRQQNPDPARGHSQRCLVFKYTR